MNLSISGYQCDVFTTFEARRFTIQDFIGKWSFRQQPKKIFYPY